MSQLAHYFPLYIVEIVRPYPLYNRSVKSRPIIELGRLAIADDDKLPGADLTSKVKKFDPLRQS